MKRTLISIMFLCIAGLAMAQEKNETEFKMNLGDTIVWKPFDNCGAIGYDITGANVISYKPINYGEQIQIITKQTGNATVTATCNNDAKAVALIIVETPVVPVPVVKIEKPATQPFTAAYSFNPPADHFFITIMNHDSNCRETYVKVGNKEAVNDGLGVDRFWDIKNGENWYYRPEAQGWTDDVRWEFEPLGKSFFPLDAFANEVNDKDNLSNYYVGMERVLDVNCWHFFVENEDGSVTQYWVDPANGCTLKRQVNDGYPREVVVYDLNYTKLYFGPSFKKGLHDTRR